jgi:hypothetical protein
MYTGVWLGNVKERVDCEFVDIDGNVKLTGIVREWEKK